MRRPGLRTASAVLVLAAAAAPACGRSSSEIVAAWCDTAVPHVIHLYEQQLAAELRQAQIEAPDSVILEAYELHNPTHVAELAKARCLTGIDGEQVRDCVDAATDFVGAMSCKSSLTRSTMVQFARVLGNARATCECTSISCAQRHQRIVQQARWDDPLTAEDPPLRSMFELADGCWDMIGDVTVTWEADPHNDDEPRIRKLAPFHYQVERELIEELFTHPERFKGMRIVPAIKGGAPSGFKLYALRDDSIFSYLGFLNEDLVRTVNGQALTPRFVRDNANALRDADRWELQLERAGTEVTLVIEVVDTP